MILSLCCKYNDVDSGRSGVWCWTAASLAPVCQTDAAITHSFGFDIPALSDHKEESIKRPLVIASANHQRGNYSHLSGEFRFAGRVLQMRGVLGNNVWELDVGALMAVL